MPGKKKATKKTEPTPATAANEEKPRKPRAPKINFDVVQVWAVIEDTKEATPVDVLEDKAGAELCAKSYTDQKKTKTLIEERDALVVATTIPGGRGKPTETKREFYVLDPDFDQPMLPGASDFSRLAAARAAAIAKLSPVELLALGITDGPPEAYEGKPAPKKPKPEATTPAGTPENPASATDDDEDDFDDEDEDGENESDGDDDEDPFAEAED